MQHARLVQVGSAAAVSASASPGRHFLLQKAQDYHSLRTHSWDSTENAAAITEFIIAVNLENKHLVLLATFPFSHLTLMVTAKLSTMNSDPGTRTQGTAMGPVLSLWHFSIQRDAAQQSQEGTRLFQTPGEPAIHHA